MGGLVAWQEKKSAQHEGSLWYLEGAGVEKNGAIV